MLNSSPEYFRVGKEEREGVVLIVLPGRSFVMVIRLCEVSELREKLMNFIKRTVWVSGTLYKDETDL